MPSISGDPCPMAFGPHLARNERPRLLGAVSRVTKAPFYTTEVQIKVHSAAVLLGLAPACHRWISDLPLCFQQTPSSLVGLLYRPSLAEISERPEAPGSAPKRLLERINDRTTYALLGESISFLHSCIWHRKLRISIRKNLVK